MIIIAILIKLFVQIFQLIKNQALKKEHFLLLIIMNQFPFKQFKNNCAQN